MKKFLWLFVFSLLSLYHQMNAAEISTASIEEDEKAIQQIVENWMLGWSSCNAKLAVQGFAEDIDWINAFGVKKKGREEVQKFLSWVFSLPNAKERKDTETITLIRFIRPRVVIVYSDFHVGMQKYLTGEETENREGHIIRVLVKDERKWEIVSMFMMEKPNKYRA